MQLQYYDSRQLQPLEIKDGIDNVIFTKAINLINMSFKMGIQKQVSHVCEISSCVIVQVCES